MQPRVRQLELLLPTPVSTTLVSLQPSRQTVDPWSKPDTPSLGGRLTLTVRERCINPEAPTFSVHKTSRCIPCGAQTPTPSPTTAMVLLELRHVPRTPTQLVMQDCHFLTWARWSKPVTTSRVGHQVLLVARSTTTVTPQPLTRFSTQSGL